MHSSFVSVKDIKHLRIIFMGTPDFSAQILAALLHAATPIVAVYTNPDMPAGRRRTLVASPTKEAAQRAHIPVYQPERLRDRAVIGELAALQPDLIIVASYGHILPRAVILLPRFGCLNVHASLLPEFRGSSPIHAAIREGKPMTGITLMKMDEGLDTGDIIAQRRVLIEPRETFTTLHDKLAHAGAQLLVETLPGWIAGSLSAVPQNHALATQTRLLQKSDGRIDWHQDAAVIDRNIRAFQVWPHTFTRAPNGKQLKISEAEVATPAASVMAGVAGRVPGTVMFPEGQLVVVCGADSALLITQIQVEGKRPISGEEFARGYRQFEGMVLG